MRNQGVKHVRRLGPGGEQSRRLRLRQAQSSTPVEANPADFSTRGSKKNRVGDLLVKKNTCKREGPILVSAPVCGRGTKSESARACTLRTPAGRGPDPQRGGPHETQGTRRPRPVFAPGRSVCSHSFPVGFRRHSARQALRITRNLHADRDVRRCHHRDLCSLSRNTEHRGFGFRAF